MEAQEARDLIMREAIFLVFSLAGVVIATKLLGGPDVFNSLKMRVFLIAKRGGQSQADAWQRFANAAATSYQKARL